MKNIAIAIIAILAVVVTISCNGGYEEECTPATATAPTAATATATADTSLISWDGGLTDGFTSYNLHEVKGNMKIPLNFKWRGHFQGRNIILIEENGTLVIINNSKLEDDNVVLSGRHPRVCFKATGFTSYEMSHVGSPYDKHGEFSLGDRSKITLHYPEGMVEIYIIDEF